MSCSYYEFRNNDYYCNLKHDYVNSDVYYKYCRNYEYASCPIYKDYEGRDRTCYLTNACTYTIGLPDNCHELQMLRYFRDSWLSKSENGRAIIRDYYEVAPKIVSKINEEINPKQDYWDIYNEMVYPCVQLIEEEKYVDALELYQEKTMQLAKKFL